MINQITMPDAVIFDWDDTLVDNWNAIHKCLNMTLIEMGHSPWSYEKTKSNVRLSMRDQFPIIFGSNSERASTVFRDYIERYHLENFTVLQFAAEMLETIHGKGIFMGVASNKNGDILRKQVKYLRWEKWLCKVVGANDADKDKPNRDPIDLVLAGSGIKSGRSVWFVGDAPSDMECAHNAGVFGILIRSEMMDMRQFKKFPPDLVINNCMELISVINKTDGIS